MKPAPPVTRTFLPLTGGAQGDGRSALGGPSSSMRARSGSRGHARRLLVGVLGGNTRLGALLVVLFLDAGPLPVADQPAQELRFVDPDDEPVGRVEDGRIVDELAGGALPAVELAADRVQMLRETAQVAGE